MIKKLLFGAALSISALMNAQSGKIVAGSILASPYETPQSITAGKSTATASCYTISTLTGTSLTIYSAGSDTSTPGCSPKAGYIFGSNCYKDKEKANFFAATNYSSVTQPSVSQVAVFFFGGPNLGTSGSPLVAVNLALYAGTNATNSPGASIATASANLALIVAAHTNTASNVWVYTYSFTPAVAIPTTGLFTSLIVPITAGDTAAMASVPNAPANLAWEKASDNNWYDVSVSWNGLKGNLAMIPTVCGNSVVATGISGNSGLSKNISIMPNPSTGLVNISVALHSQQDLNITVTNALGQVVNTASYQSIMLNNLTLDLTNQTNGIYFVTINNGKDKMVQRLIINR